MELQLNPPSLYAPAMDQENSPNGGMKVLAGPGGRRVRCISCSETSYPPTYEDPALLLNVRTRHYRTPSICEQIQEEQSTGTVVYFCRSRGHGFIRPDTRLSLSPCRVTSNNNPSHISGSEDIFVHISDIDSDYVPRKGDKVSYKVCPFPPKFEKFQAVHVKIISMSPQPHNRWDTPGTREETEEGEGNSLPAGDV